MNNIESMRNLAQKQNNAYSHAAEIIDKIIPIIERFNGKQANKRLETALEAVDAHILCRKNQYSDHWEITWYCTDDHIMCGSGMYTHAAYIKQREITLLTDWSNKCVDENGKWRSEMMVEMLKLEKQQLLERFNALNKQIAEVEIWEKRRDELREEIASYNKEIMWEIKQYFSLDL